MWDRRAARSPLCGDDLVVKVFIFDTATYVIQGDPPIGGAVRNATPFIL